MVENGDVIPITAVAAADFLINSLLLVGIWGNVRIVRIVRMLEC